MKTQRTLAFLSLTLILLSGISASLAGDKTWNGGTSTNWDTPSNWVGGVVPLDDDDIIIPGARSNFPNLTANRKMKSLTIESGGSVTFSNGTATVDNGAVDNSGTIIVNGGTLDIKNATGNLTNSGSVTVSSGEIKVGGKVTNNSGANLITSGGAITINTDGSTNAGTMNFSSGTLKFNGRNITNLAAGIINQTGGAFEASNLIVSASSNVNFNTGNFTYKGNLTNSGTVTVSSGTTTIDGLFSNQVGGNLLVNGGTLYVKGNAANENYGTIAVSSGTLDLATNNNDLTVYAGGTLNQTGGAVKIRDLTVDATGSYTFSGTTLDIKGDLVNSGTVTLNPGTVNVAGHINTEIGSEFTLAGASFTAGDNATFAGTVNISGGTLDLGTNNKAAFVDGATFNQTGGTIITEDLELKNGATYNQSGGDLKVDHDLKIPPGTTFASTGGTVYFTGNQGGGADYTGNVQFYNVVVESGGTLNMDKDGDNIKIAGNFTNSNPDLDNDKGTVTFNGTTPQTISSASTPADTKTTFANMVVTNSSGVSLETDLGLHTSFSYNSGGYLDLDGNILYVNGEIYDGPLPVELSSFSAVILENGVKLNWKTETEVSNYGFEILRSAQNDRWEKIGFAEGHGNSNSPKDYSFVDENVIAGKYSYRLKQIDTDGKFEYSNVIEFDLGSPISYELSQNYPNPFNPSTTIRFSVSESSFINLSVFNSLGEEVKELLNEVKEPGIYTIEFNAQDLPSGTYIYRIQTTDFVQTKKMMLVK